nr:hypothetical protein [uncultured Oscillibacter sp.]
MVYESDSFLLVCLLMLRYIALYHLGSLWMALGAGLVPAGAAAQFFLSRRRRWRWALPLLCGGALAVLAALYHLNIRGVVQLLRDEGIILYCVLGALVLCALLGTGVGVLARLVWERFHADGRTGQGL